MNTEFQNLPNVVSPKEVQTYFGIANLLRHFALDHLSDISRRDFSCVPHWKPTAGAAR